MTAATAVDPAVAELLDSLVPGCDAAVVDCHCDECRGQRPHYDECARPAAWITWAQCATCPATTTRILLCSPHTVEIARETWPCDCGGTQHVHWEPL
jgi:hypothetical protein